MKADSIVIGAGPNGLVAALVLAKAGRRVLVLEAASAVGGRTRPIEFAPGFRASLDEDDGCVLRAVWRLLPRGSPAITRLTRRYAMSVPDGDGVLVTLPSWSRAPEPVLARYSARDAERWPVFLSRFARYKYVLERLYEMAPPDIDTTSSADLLRLATLGLRVRLLGRTDMTEFLRVMPMSVQDLTDDEFQSEPLKAAVASAAVRNLRQGPRSGGTVYNLLHHMVGATGLRSRSWPVAAPDAFAVATADVCRTLGVEVRTGARVAQITVRDSAVSGVALATGDEIDARTVISTVDPRRTMLGLVAPEWLDPEFSLAVSSIKLRGATAYVLYASDAPVAEPFIAPVSLTATTEGLEHAADAAKYGEVSTEPHVEVFAPTLRWPALAPRGRHIVVARVQYAPYALRDSVWDTARATALERTVTAAIARVIPKFGDSVHHVRVMTPRDLEAEFGVAEGAFTHGEVMLDQILFMRPIPGWSRYAMPIRGLFLGGSGAHPGPGVLGGAGLLAAQAALK